MKKRHTLVKALVSVALFTLIVGGLGALFSRRTRPSIPPAPPPEADRPAEPVPSGKTAPGTQIEKAEVPPPPPATTDEPRDATPKAAVDPPKAPPASTAASAAGPERTAQTKPLRRPAPLRRESVGAPAPAPTAVIVKGEASDYHVRFASDAALGSTVRAARAWVYACAPTGGLFFVPVEYEGHRTHVAPVAPDCGAATRAKLRLRRLQRPTPALLQALGIDPTGFSWYLQLDPETLGRRVDALVTGLGAGSRRSLVEIGEDGAARVVGRVPRLGRRGS